MTSTPSELSLSVVDGARVVALELLGAADQASRRLAGHERDEEALHDFRVAVRRLRSWVRAFDDELAVRKRHKKQLRAIAHATNPGRDTEVQLEWLREVAKCRGKLAQQGVRWMISVLERRHTDANSSIGHLIVSDFAELHAEFEQAFTLARDNASPASAPDSAAKPHTALAIAIAERITSGLDELRRKLVDVRSITDDVPSHEARIAAKRLRYLIEPAVPHTTGGDALLRQLKKIQDDLGELHDRYVMARELCALAERSAALSARATVCDALGAFGARVAADAAQSEQDARDDYEPDPDEEDLRGAALHDVEEPAPPRAFAAVARRLRADLTSQFRRAHDRWLGDRHEPLGDALTRFAERLRSDFEG